MTHFPYGSPQAAIVWSAALARDTKKMSYWQRFTGGTNNHVVQEFFDLSKSSGLSIRYDLLMRLRQPPTIGDNVVEGKEEALRMHQDEVVVSLVRHGVDVGGMETRQASVHPLRQHARANLGIYFAEWKDELHFNYASGAMGDNADSLFSAAPPNSPFVAPDADHHMFGGAAASLATITQQDILQLRTISNAKNKALMLNARNSDAVAMRPVRVNSKQHFIMLMSTDQENMLRNEVNTSGTTWLQIQQAAAAAQGQKNPIFQGGLGIYDDVVLHSRNNVRMFNSGAGAGGNLPYHRALFLGAQALVCAFGRYRRKTRMYWREEVKDAGNRPMIYAGFVIGVTKTRFNGKDFGVIAVDTYAKDPTT